MITVIAVKIVKKLLPLLPVHESRQYHQINRESIGLSLVICPVSADPVAAAARIVSNICSIRAFACHPAELFGSCLASELMR